MCINYIIIQEVLPSDDYLEIRNCVHVNLLLASLLVESTVCGGLKALKTSYINMKHLCVFLTG